MYVLHNNKKTKIYKGCLTNFVFFSYLIMTVNGEIYGAFNLDIITNIVTIVPRGHFTKERNNS